MSFVDRYGTWALVVGASMGIGRARSLEALYDQLADGPVCCSRPEDEWIARSTLALPPHKAAGSGPRLQETSIHAPDRHAT